MPARLARIDSNGAHHDVPPRFAMSFPSTFLVFESRFDDTAGAYEPDYSVYRLASVGAPTEGVDPVGRIPVSDVELDERRGLTLKTLGIERFL